MITPLDQAMAVDEHRHLESEEGKEEFGMSMFAFHDLDYIPSGYSGVLAPYIETSPGSQFSSFVSDHNTRFRIFRPLRL